VGRNLKRRAFDYESLEFFIGPGAERDSWQLGAARCPAPCNGKGGSMKNSPARLAQQYGLPFLAVIAGHVFLLWALVKGLAMAAPQPPEVVVMASIISAPVIAPEIKAQPAPPQPQPKAQPKVQKPQALAVKKTQPTAAKQVYVAPAPEKAASAPEETQKNTLAQESSGAPTKGEVSPVEVQPTVVGAGNKPKVEYPALSQRLGEEGTAIIRLQVSVDGGVIDARVEKSSGYPRLDNAALDAVRKARFKPGTRGGVPVVMWARQPIKFDLANPS
jgi:protein TonB